MRQFSKSGNFWGLTFISCAWVHGSGYPPIEAMDDIQKASMEAQLEVLARAGVADVFELGADMVRLTVVLDRTTNTVIVDVVNVPVYGDDTFLVEDDVGEETLIKSIKKRTDSVISRIEGLPSTVWRLDGRDI